MLYLVTAVPGSGKTLFLLNWLKSKAEKENRQVYYYNIPLSKKGKEVTQWIEIDDPHRWPELLPGSYLVIDECQEPFPVRRSGKETPRSVELLAKHRHKGVDIVFITQHPTLVDSFIRRLIGTHIHLIRQFGAERSTVLTWQEGCQENPNAKSAQKTCMDRKTFVFPREVYSWYKSSEMHTHKFQMPLRLKQMLIMIAFSITAVFLAFFFIYRNLYAKPKEQAESVSRHESSAPAASAATPSLTPAVATNDQQGRVIKTAATFLNDRQPRVPGMPDSAPAYDELTQPRTFPKVTACIASKLKCSCFNQQGSPVEMEEYRCRYYVDKGWFDPYLAPNEQHERREMAAPHVTNKPVELASVQPQSAVKDFGSKDNFPRSFK